MFELFHIIIVIGYFIYIGSHIHRTERKGFKYIQKNIFVSSKNFVKDSINKIILLSFILFLGFTVSSTKSIILFIIVTLLYFLLNSPWNEFLLLNIFLRFSEIYKDMELFISVATLTLIIMTIIYVDDFISNSEQDFDWLKIAFFYLKCLFLYFIYDIGYVKILSIICNSNIIVFNKNNTYTLLFYATIC